MRISALPHPFLADRPHCAACVVISATIDAAGRIHTDFERGFICAETIAYDDYIASGGEQKAKEAGRMRQEGRDYAVKDGDVILFRFNV